MRARFLTALAASFVLTLLLVGVVAYGVSVISVPVPRNPLRTAAFEFDLAPGWSCELEGTEWVCKPSEKQPYAAIAIMATKIRGPQDTLQAYEDHLRTPQKVSQKPGVQEEFSNIVSVERIKLGSREWVEGMHEGSEVRNYATYYLATVTSDLGILFTMSYHSKEGRKYITELRDMMKTLRSYQR